MNFGIEIFTIGLLGMVLSLWSLVSSWLEFNALLIKELNGSKKIAAVTNILRDSVKFTLQGAIMMIGIDTMFGDVGPPMHQVTWLFVSVLLSFSLTVDRLRRVRIAHMYDEMASPHTHQRASDPAPPYGDVE